MSVHILHVLVHALLMMIVQQSLYFKTTHGTMKMWSYIAGAVKKGSVVHKFAHWDQNRWPYNQGGLKIRVVK